MVEILMDLVDLNYDVRFIHEHIPGRDPYGSRGSKSFPSPPNP